MKIKSSYTYVCIYGKTFFFTILLIFICRIYFILNLFYFLTPTHTAFGPYFHFNKFQNKLNKDLIKDNFILVCINLCDILEKSLFYNFLGVHFPKVYGQFHPQAISCLEYFIWRSFEIQIIPYFR